jgi:3-oxoacyl-[acyl-carrier protein] reductase
MIKMEGKTVVITGAARGIGLTIAETFAVANANVILVDLMEDALEEAKQKVKNNSASVLAYSADVTDGNRMSDIFKEVYKQFGKIDILINNAGITKDGLLMKMKEADWDAVIKVNLKGAFICTQKISRFMLKQKDGIIINMASVIGLMGNAGQANYAASKGGLIAFTKSCAKEFASRNIRVNAIAPGFIATEMTKTLPEDVVQKYAENIPLNRMGTTQDVANACLFLASDLAKYITGQTIQVDGGLIM